jgi:nucleotide-binding universal stress UspA family protein
MNATATPRPVVVGVTGKGENTDALAYAVREARAAGCALHLVSAVHDVIPMPPPAMHVEPVPWQRIGKSVLDEVEAELAELDVDDLEILRTVRLGPAGSVLVELSAEASLVVLQHRSLSRLHRLFTGSTVVAVAANSHCPLVSVPHGWRPGQDDGRVVVGMHEDGAPREVLTAAFDQAARHGWSLHLVHGWWLDPLYADWLQDELPPWSDEMEASLKQAVAPFGETHPEVKVDTEVRHQSPADALVELAQSSPLVVVGRHGSGRFLPHRIGSIARTLVSTAPCPVMVVPV